MHESCQADADGGFQALARCYMPDPMSMLDPQAPTQAQPVAHANAPLPNGGLEVISIAKSYDKRSVLSDISLTVGKGEVLGLLGPNGAGKTTCFYSIMGLVRPDSGRILMDGEDVTKLPMYRRAVLGLGYLPQETSIFRGMTVEQNIDCVLELVEPDKATRAQELERLLDEFGLTRLRESPAMALSGGERRRCEIARALAAKPSIMLLDEPFAGIDPLSISDIRDLVKDLKTRGIGVLITDHNVRETLEIVDRACIIYGGQVLFAASRRTQVVKAVSSQVPFVHGLSSALRYPLRHQPVAMWMAIRDALRGEGEAPLYMPIISADGSTAALICDECVAGYSKLVPKGQEGENKVAARFLFSLPFFYPIDSAPKVQAPTLVIAAAQDGLIPVQKVRDTAKALPRGEYVELAGAHHFSPYSGPVFEQVVARQTAFFRQHLAR